MNIEYYILHRISKKLEQLRTSIKVADYEKPFSNLKDAFERLLPFSFHYEPGLPDDVQEEHFENCLFVYYL